jgi:hypothetical protein
MTNSSIKIVIRTKKKYISDDLLELGGRGKTESSNSNESEIVFSSMHHPLFLVDCNKNTRKNVHFVVKVTFDP